MKIGGLGYPLQVGPGAPPPRPSGVDPFGTRAVIGVIHQDIREWVAKMLRLDLATASPAELAKLDEVTRLAEIEYVRQMLSLPEYRPRVG